MQSRIDDFHGLDAEILAIVTDSVEENRDIVESYSLDYPILSDPDLVAIDAFGVRHPGGWIEGDIARPATFIVDRSGYVAWRNLTENWRVRPRPGELLEQLARLP